MSYDLRLLHERFSGIFSLLFFDGLQGNERALYAGLYCFTRWSYKILDTSSFPLSFLFLSFPIGPPLLDGRRPPV